MKKIIFIAKTDLNNDGRILNQIKILQNYLKDQLNLHFIVLPDKEYVGDLGRGVFLYNLHISIRNNPALRMFTVVEFTIKALRKLIELQPEIIHIQDYEVVLPVYLYKKFFKKNVVIIFDDHEMPNENESLQGKILQYFERKLMKISDYVIYANQERKEILDKELNIIKSTYFLNLPYFEEKNILSNASIDRNYITKLEELKAFKEKGINLIMHQGLIAVERGRKKLAEFSKFNFANTKIVIVGISELEYNSFITEFTLNRDNFYFVGSVPYTILIEFWKLMDATIIMYLPTYINNRLCAPNRYFIALMYNIPTIVNKDNPVLYNFTEKHNSGFYIENITSSILVKKVFKHSYSTEVLEDMKHEEIEKFEGVYDKILKLV
ncbi:hypothetical protein [Flavobacterium sp. SM2513]|uniref:hypothetical protein n=1 Tax=Flavobacterium sp. SM2513 TaxID=3424766 RepID=UPI003D7F293F